MTEKFNVANIEYGSEIYGPGIRTVIWFQGCNLGCKGCWNVDFQSLEPNILVNREDLLKDILDHSMPVTFLGGEPLLQSDNLSWLVSSLKDHSIHMMLYTGHELEEIERNPQWSEICKTVDILISGRYIERLRNTNLSWRGSSNQPIIFNSNPEDVDECNQVEVTIGPNGSITCLGYPSDGLRLFLKNIDFQELN